MHPYGEVLPRATNRITVDGTQKDRYGVAVVRIDYDIGDNERKMVEAMYDTAEEILHEMKAEALPYRRGEIDKFGSAIHEHGTCRMGSDPKRSASRQVLPHARGQEPLRGRRQRLSHRNREEPHPHHPGPLVAGDRLPVGADAKKRAVIARSAFLV